MTTKTKWIIGGIAVLTIAYLTKDKWMPKKGIALATEPKKDEKSSNARGSRAGAKDDGVRCYYGKCGEGKCWDKSHTSCS